jgi:hypothetical protein
MSIESGQAEVIQPEGTRAEGARPERKRSARRGWIEFIIAVVMVLAAPIVISVQSGEANEPWDEIWLGNWPVLAQQDTAAADPATVALQLRVEAALARVLQPEQTAPGRVSALD